MSLGKMRRHWDLTGEGKVQKDPTCGFLPTGGGAYGDVIPFPETPRVYVSARMGWGSL